MVTRAGGYYGRAFQGAFGVTQVHPVSSTIFNVVVDAVVHNWVTVVTAGVEETGCTCVTPNAPWNALP